MRYLTASDTTYIIECQYNGPGLSEAEMDDFFAFAAQADALYREQADPALLLLARRLNRDLLSDRPLGRRYLYVRVTQKEPRDILYFTPGVTLQCNLDDGSFSIAPEAVYTGYADWELRARVFLLFGPAGTEFGEKPSKGRLELMARRFF